MAYLPTTTSRRLAWLSAPLALLATTAALAHPGVLPHTHGGSFAAGIMHPLTGLDHLLAMLAIGLWSARQAPMLRRWMPLVIALGMICGAGLAWAGVPLLGVEFGIASSVLLAGILVATLVKLPTAVGGPLVFAFILMHGHAHGSELAPDASAALFALGFLISSVGITLVGRTLGSWLSRRDSRWLRGIGAAIAAVGGSMLLS
ncbi:HupE/UreJ family protein [Salinicola rhizosphaerae]|uniref:Urease accessory protein n=1 Tax=Salinicola rhizosphaerae TaxID=1443141 RepID=A0ABQ3E1N7_9GAMM|nr:HupE/UreJ family protein [Salinicola rhizosphaerae]GHB23534.1 urease accessory protein [Salinicola rhizosphaerae]